MAKRILVSVAGVLAAGHLVLHTLNAAPPPCGKHACSVQIANCQDAECSGLSGNERAACRKTCVEAVEMACQENPSLCAASPSGAFLG